jgi:hypothetical protein
VIWPKELTEGRSWILVATEELVMPFWVMLSSTEPGLIAPAPGATNSGAAAATVPSDPTRTGASVKENPAVFAN